MTPIVIAFRRIPPDYYAEQQAGRLTVVTKAIELRTLWAYGILRGIGISGISHQLAGPDAERFKDAIGVENRWYRVFRRILPVEYHPLLQS